MTGAVAITAVDARRITDQIKAGVEAVWHLIEQAYTTRAWSALGYQSWDDYCTREFGTSRLRLPREERQEVVASLRESGLSIRAIAAATGDHYSTISRELGRVADATPDAEPIPITGTDGKTYKPKPADYFPVEGPLSGDRDIAPRTTADDLEALNVPSADESAPVTQPQPKRKPLEEQFFHSVERLNSTVTTLTNLSADDRLPRNKEKVARYRNDLLLAIDALHRVANTLAQGA